MVQIVSSFAAVGGPPYRYTYLLVVSNTYFDAVRDELNRQAEAFAADLRGEGVLARSFPQRIYDTAREVLDKPWPSDVSDRMEYDSDPFIVVIDQPFREFDPQEHPYAVVWLADFHTDPESVRPLLQTLARKTKADDDVVLYLRDVAQQAQRAARAEEGADALSAAARIASYVEIKPRVFGVSIDLKAVLRDIAERHRQ